MAGNPFTALKNLLIPNKTQDPVAQPNYQTDARSIEIWAAGLLKALQASGIYEITSTDGSVTITDPFGPVTDLSAPGGYASLTGPGKTVPLGALTQGGNFTVNGTLTSLGEITGDNTIVVSSPHGQSQIFAGVSSGVAGIQIVGDGGFDDGVIRFTANGTGSGVGPAINFIFLVQAGAPTMTMASATWCFLDQLGVGHIYFNPGGAVWTLVV